MASRRATHVNRSIRSSPVTHNTAGGDLLIYWNSSPEGGCCKPNYHSPLEESVRQGRARSRTGEGGTESARSLHRSFRPRSSRKGPTRRPVSEYQRRATAALASAWHPVFRISRPDFSPGGRESGDGGIVQEIVPEGIAPLRGRRPEVHPPKSLESGLLEGGPVGLGFEVEVRAGRPPAPEPSPGW